jgi:hypothetical protein
MLRTDRITWRDRLSVVKVLILLVLLGLAVRLLIFVVVFAAGFLFRS